ncbi:SAF domain-containing protein [Luteococcus peritonei]|uniref:SAF domain-containing protein n=1 Tax=Luteococcus peritonei TaxID=88874 RepID=A0ABW4RV47_9ACTN
MLRRSTPQKSSAAGPDEAVGPRLRARRSPRMIAAGVALACLGGLGGAMAFQEATHANQVVVVQRQVARGEVVGNGDLSVVTIGSAPGVSTLPAERLPELVGGTALVDLPEGTLVGEGAVGEPQLPAGHSEIGIKLAAGRIPNQAMPAGTPVDLVEISGEGAEFSSLVVRASVASAPQRTADGSAWVLDVRLPQAQAQRIADLAAHDRIALVRKAA